jgi:hypothetical protein
LHQVASDTESAYALAPSMTLTRNMAHCIGSCLFSLGPWVGVALAAPARVCR